MVAVQPPCGQWNSHAPVPLQVNAHPGPVQVSVQLPMPLQTHSPPGSQFCSTTPMPKLQAAERNAAEKTRQIKATIFFMDPPRRYDDARAIAAPPAEYRESLLSLHHAARIGAAIDRASPRAGAGDRAVLRAIQDVAG